MSYPDKIIILRDTEEFNLLYRHSKLFQRIVDTYSENKDEITLSSTLFGGNDDEWHMFLDVFFPEKGIGKFFIFKNKSIQVNPERGTKEVLINLLDYMMIDEDTMMNFARAQARKQINAPLNTAPAGTGTHKKRSTLKLKKYKYPRNNINYNNNSEPNLGYTSEEYALLGRVPTRNIHILNTRRTTKGKKKTRSNVSK